MSKKHNLHLIGRANPLTTRGKHELKQLKKYDGIKEHEHYIFNLIKENFSYDNTILEIGFGEGRLLEKLYKDGYKDIVAIDIREDCILNLQKKNLKIEIYNVDICETSNFYSLYSKHFDIIIINDVLEHLENPYKCFENLILLQNQHTHIFISTPNDNALFRLVGNSHAVAEMNTGHITIWSEFQYYVYGLIFNYKIIYKKYLQPIKYFPRLKGIGYVLKYFYYILFKLGMFKKLSNHMIIVYRCKK